MEALFGGWNFHYQLAIAALTRWSALCTRVCSFARVCVLLSLFLGDFSTNWSLMEVFFFSQDKAFVIYFNTAKGQRVIASKLSEAEKVSYS